MSELLAEEINGVSIFFKQTKPVEKFFIGRHVVFQEKDTEVFYYVREKPGHIKTDGKFSSIYETVNEVPELTEYFSVIEEIFKDIVLKGEKLMILIKGPEIDYVKAMLLEADDDPSKSWDHPDKFIGFVTPRGREGRPLSKSYMFKTSAATLIKNNDN